MKTIICKLFHRKFHVTKFFCDGVAFGFRAGECTKCGRRWNGGKLAINYHTQEVVILLDNTKLNSEWGWYNQN